MAFRRHVADSVGDHVFFAVHTQYNYRNTRTQTDRQTDRRVIGHSVENTVNIGCVVTWSGVLLAHNASRLQRDDNNKLSRRAREMMRDAF